MIREGEHQVGVDPGVPLEGAGKCSLSPKEHSVMNFENDEEER